MWRCRLPLGEELCGEEKPNYHRFRGWLEVGRKTVVLERAISGSSIGETTMATMRPPPMTNEAVYIFSEVQMCVNDDKSEDYSCSA